MAAASLPTMKLSDLDIIENTGKFTDRKWYII